MLQLLILLFIFKFVTQIFDSFGAKLQLPEEKAFFETIFPKVFLDYN